MVDEVTFTIKVTMRKRWVDHFVSFLKRMEYLGNVGSSRTVAFYADGDGDFQPKFEADVDYNNKQPRKVDNVMKVHSFYDAG